MTPYSFYSSNGFAGLASEGADKEQNPSFMVAGTEHTSEMMNTADAAGEMNILGNTATPQQQDTMDVVNMDISSGVRENIGPLHSNLAFPSKPPGSPTRSDSSNDTNLDDLPITSINSGIPGITDAIATDNDDKMEFTSDRLRIRRRERWDEIIALTMTFRDVLIRIRPQWDDEGKDKMGMMFAEMVQEVDETPTAVEDLSNMFEGLMRE